MGAPKIDTISRIATELNFQVCHPQVLIQLSRALAILILYQVLQNQVLQLANQVLQNVTQEAYQVFSPVKQAEI